MRWSSLFPLLCMMLLAHAAGGCDRAEPDPASTGQAQPMRLVSLSPAISRTLVDLGLGDHVVGRTPYCESLDQSVPIVGDLLNLDYEQLVRIAPTHVLVQPPATGIDRTLVTMANERRWTIGSWRLDGLSDIRTLLNELPALLGSSTAADRAAMLHVAIDQSLQRDDEDRWRGTVLLVAATDPVGTFGTGTYLHDVLTALGAENAVIVANYPQLTLEDVTRINPQAVILVRPGAPRDLDPVAAQRSLARLDIAANRTGRVAVLRHPDAFMPSSAIVGVADQLREILRSFADEREHQEP